MKNSDTVKVNSLFSSFFVALAIPSLLSLPNFLLTSLSSQLPLTCSSSKWLRTPISMLASLGQSSTFFNTLFISLECLTNTKMQSRKALLPLIQIQKQLSFLPSNVFHSWNNASMSLFGLPNNPLLYGR
jgi:hypothetical protein